MNQATSSHAQADAAAQAMEVPGSGHYVNRAGWLRAAVLGANDGLLSTGSLMAGVAAAQADARMLLVTGVAAIVAGALSMATGEYVSVSSQADSEKADLRREKRALHERPHAELDELTAIYEERGLEAALARQVAEALTQKGALDAHARDELGIAPGNQANPLLAGLASAASFVAGGLPVLAMAVLFAGAHVLAALFTMSVVMLALLGALGAWAGGAPMLRGVLRVVVFGALTVAVTALVGRAFHVAV